MESGVASAAPAEPAPVSTGRRAPQRRSQAQRSDAALAAEAESVEEKPAEPEPVATREPVEQEPAEPAREEGELSLAWVRGNWNQFLLKIKPRSYQVRALLNSAVPVAVKAGVITLGCEAGFHAEKLGEDRKRTLIEEVLTEVLGRAVRVECRVQEDVREILREASQPAPDGVGDIFSTPSQASDSRRDELRNHPTVKALEERGGRVSRVSLYDEDPQGGR